MFFLFIIGYFLLINVVTFVIWGIDKRKAVKGKWRISEKNLLILSLLGGFVGAIFGMQIFHHKTIKSKFLIPFWVSVSFWLIVLCVLFYFYLRS